MADIDEGKPETIFTLTNVKARLEAFGYTPKDTDDSAITYAMEKVRSYIKNEVCWADVPDGLQYQAIEMSCGEFLQIKKTFAPADLSNLDLTKAVQQITTGDVSTTFDTATQSDEQRLDTLISALIHCADGQFSVFRRVRW